MVWYLAFTDHRILSYPLHLICMPILLLLRFNYFYKWSVFATCTGHGKPASNRVAFTQLLTAYLGAVLNSRLMFTEGDLLPLCNRMATVMEAGSLLCLCVVTWSILGQAVPPRLTF